MQCKEVSVDTFQGSALWMRGRLYALEMMLEVVEGRWMITGSAPSAAMTPLTAPPGCSTWRMGTAGSRQLQTALRVIQSSCGEPNRVQVDTKISNVHIVN